MLFDKSDNNSNFHGVDRKRKTDSSQEVYFNHNMTFAEEVLPCPQTELQQEKTNYLHEGEDKEVEGGNHKRSLTLTPTKKWQNVDTVEVTEYSKQNGDNGSKEGKAGGEKVNSTI